MIILQLMIYNYILIYTLLSNTVIIFVIKIKYYNMAEKQKRIISIKRDKKSEEQNPPQQEKNSSLKNEGIILVSQEQESDPFKVELLQKGYSIISENEFGVTVRKAIGKPTFMLRTKNGYLEKLKPNNLYLPESTNIAMKMRIAGLGINSQQYLAQLVMKDLIENNLL